MILGFDASSYLEVLEKGGTYTVHGEKVDPFLYLHDVNGCSYLRLRLWVDPYDEDGHPYGGGTNDLVKFIALAKKGHQDGYQILLDFHFSDFWCDPGKQYIPKSWPKDDFTALSETLGNYVKDTLEAIQAVGIPIAAIQIGNEITNGMLWPLGKIEWDEATDTRHGYENLTHLLKVGIASAKAIFPAAKILIHLERSYDQAVYVEYFDELAKAGVEYDIIGLSYYPYWHHSFEELFANIDALQKRYGKETWIVETSYGFTYETAYKESIPFPPLVNEKLFEKGDAREPYPLTKEGQVEFITTLLSKAKEHQVGAVFYWEPLWLPLPGTSWASKEGEMYINETEKPCTNEWANQCLFDYDGEATPGCFAYRVD
ncbi:MAG: glycosyl hydrolase 53 family protein [Bacilli bacterium]|nr:glycosyl hydrolase 53 family protein [Bacilli bacterium]